MGCFRWCRYICRFLLPASLIAINDVAAYIFGFFFGRTPLIKLSPKKTWEGFIGASVATMISAFVVSKLTLHALTYGPFFLSCWGHLTLHLVGELLAAYIAGTSFEGCNFLLFVVCVLCTKTKFLRFISTSWH